MKKILAVLACFFIAITLVACGNKNEIAMITDEGTIDDKSFNQTTWEGIKRFLEDKDANRLKVKGKYYKPDTKNKADYLAKIELAVKGGAKIVVTPGFYFAEAIYDAQTKYPDVKFVLIDGVPNNGKEFGATDFKEEVKENTVSIQFKDADAGFLAGYAAYKEGFRKLGFAGGQPVPAVMQYGTGYIAGIYQAAKDGNTDKQDAFYNASNHIYLESFNAEDRFVAQTKTMYDTLDVIFACAGGAGNSVMKAAEDKTTTDAPKWVIGVDSNQKGQSKRVITSALKGLDDAIYRVLKEFYAEDSKFEGGKQIKYSAKENASRLPDDYERFKKFNKTQYDEIFGKLKNGTIDVPNNGPELTAFLKKLDVLNLDEAAAATYYAALEKAILNQK